MNFEETPEVVDPELLEQERAAAARQGEGGWGEAGEQRAQNFFGTLKRVIGLLRPHAVAFVTVTVLGALSVVLAVLAPKVLSEATNIIFEGVVASQLPSEVPKEALILQLRADGQEEIANIVATMHTQPGDGIDFDRLAQVILIVLALYVGAAILAWLEGYVVNVVMVRVMWRLRQRVEEKIHRVPLKYFDQVKRGELISRVTNDIDNLTQTLQQSLSQVITSVLTVIGVVVMMLTISWKLTLVALAVLPLMAIIFGVIAPKSQKAFSLQWLKVGRLNARVEETYSGHDLVQVFGREEDTIAKFTAENEELYETSFRAQFWAGIINPAMQFVGSLAYVGIAVFGGLMVASGQIRLGAVQAFIQYSQQFTQPLAQLGGMIATLQSGMASAERIFDLLDAPEESADDTDAPALLAPRGVIELKNVAFSYAPEKPLITDLSLRVEPGQTVAIVGPTGAGKTTLVNLIMRFYEIDSGQILLDGQDIAEFPRHAIRQRMGMVLQDPWLFGGTIMENIRYGKPTATDEEIFAAAKATYVDRFVRSLPDGYHTVLEDDASNVSAGEKQLITIARAFVAEPAVLILDEATSAVDTRTEVLLQHAMTALRQGRTSFVIAHRLSTIRDADIILVMEQGDIVEQGSHEALIAQQGAYWRLYNSQFESAQG